MLKVLHYLDQAQVVQATVAVLEGLYWLQDALKLVVEEVASRLVGLVAISSFEVVATLAEVADNPSETAANPGQVAANLDLGQGVANPTGVVANLGQATATLGKVVANYYNYYNHHVFAIDYYYYNYEVDLEEY